MMDKRQRDSHLILKLIYLGAILGLAVSLFMTFGCATRQTDNISDMTGAQLSRALAERIGK